LHEASKGLYGSLTKALEYDPPSEIRMLLWISARVALQHWIDKGYFETKVQKFIGKISNGFDYCFAFIINPGVEATKS
jgi:hypothetical protein